MYSVRRVKIGKSEQLDRLALECGRLYSLTVIWFWRFVRRQGQWTSPTAMQKLIKSDVVHSQTAQATVQAFFASLQSWGKRRKTDPEAKPPHRRRKFFRIEYKNS